MYMKRMLSVGSVANGYVVECQVPVKKEMEEDEKELSHAYPGECSQQYVAKSLDEVTALIGKLMPMLDREFTSEDEFNAAFKKAAK